MDEEHYKNSKTATCRNFICKMCLCTPMKTEPQVRADVPWMFFGW